MAIKYVIEGPKGTGKSTLVKNLESKLKAQVRYFTADTCLDLPTIQSDSKTKTPVIYERGYLSRFVYGWLWNLKPDVKENPYLQVTRQDFEDLLKEVDKYIILYASVPSILHTRIDKRLKETGKGMEDFEKQELDLSNTFFIQFGKVLQEMYPSKVMMVDTCLYNTPEKLLELVHKL